MKVIALLFTHIVAGLIGLILAVTLQQSIQERWDRLLDRYWPAKALQAANKLRKSMAERELHTALHKYGVLAKRPDASASVKAQAYQGLSRTYTDLCELHYRRGLNYRDYSTIAKDYADKAEKEMPGQPATEIALAYAYDCSESEIKNPTASQAKVKQLLINHSDDSDVQFLSWSLRLDKDPESFPRKIEMQDDPGLIPLLMVESRLVDKANASTDPSQKQAYWGRAETFLARADELYPDNALLYFRHGYLAESKGNIPAARDYYIRALALEPDFPRARTNLGVTLAANQEWDNARFQFEAAAAILDSPIRSRAVAFGNLGEIYWEENDKTKACEIWSKAGQLPYSEEDAPNLFHLAMCAYPTNRRACTDNYRKAIQVGAKEGWDLTKVSTFENEWRVGPKELKFVTVLLKDCRPR